MSGLVWGPSEEARLAAIRDDLATVSTATACQLLISHGWRNSYMRGLLPLEGLGMGVRLVGRARTCRYLYRREAEGPPDPVARRNSAEIVLIESLEPGDIICIDALGVPTAGIIGDILTARIQARGALAAIVNGAVRDLPAIREIDYPVWAAGVTPITGKFRMEAMEINGPVRVHDIVVYPGDLIVADDSGICVVPAEFIEPLIDEAEKVGGAEDKMRELIVSKAPISELRPLFRKRYD